MRSKRPKLPSRKGRDVLIEEIERMMNNVDDDARALYNSLWHTMQKLKMLEIEEISGLQALFALETFEKLLKTLKEYLGFFGFKDNEIKKLIGGGN